MSVCLKNGVLDSAGCGSMVTGEEKFKSLTDGRINRHVYYHCSRSVDYDCPEPYINEVDLTKQLRDFIQELPEETLKISEKLLGSFQEYQRFTRELYRQQSLEGEPQTDIKNYARFVLREGSNKEKGELVRGLCMKLVLENKQIIQISKAILSTKSLS